VGCPHLSILSTTREVLCVAGEHVMALAPSPAATLFRERAAAANVAVELGAEQARAVD
jgi:predicted ATPase